MKRFSILFALVIAACGSDSKSNNKQVEVSPPKIEAKTNVEPGFGSGAVAINDNKLVEDKAVKELPPVEHWLPAGFAECMKLGKEMAAKGEHARARELFEAAAKLDRKSAAPHVELARSHIANNERALAIRHASKAVKLAPESSQAYNTLGRAELLRHQYDAAAIAFRQATELDANNVWAWNNLGLVYLTQKNYQEAVNALVEATGRKGVEAYMWNNLGTAYEHLDQLDEARDAFDSGAKLGSVAAKASRKRLEGVDSVKVARGGAKDSGFTTREEMPDLVIDNPEPALDEGVMEDDIEIEAPTVEGILEEPASGMVDETAVDEPKPEPEASEGAGTI